MANDDKKITIQLKVTIPFDGQPIEIESPGSDQQQVTKPEPSPTPALAVPRKKPLIIDRPSAGEEDYPVKVSGSGNSGVIGAMGRAPKFSGVYPETVHAHCFDGTMTKPFPPLAADDGVVDSADGSWMLCEIPAKCYATSPGKEQTLQVWYDYDSSSAVPPPTEKKSFFGLCSDSNICDFLQLKPPLAVSRIRLPDIMVVSVLGFSDHLGCFNGEWVLRSAPCCQGAPEVIWEMEPGSSDCSHVKLIGDLNEASARLVFQLQSTTVQYFMRSGDWNPRNVAQFCEASCRAVLPQASIPAIVTVTPA